MKKSLTSKIIGIIFATVGLAFLVLSIIFYMNTLKQTNWPTTSATITNVEKRVERNRTDKSKSITYETTYDLEYKYTIENKEYKGETYGTVYPKNIGDTLEIKYNPKAPAENTDVLEASPTNLIFGIVLSCAFIVISLIKTGAFNWLINKTKRK